MKKSIVQEAKTFLANQSQVASGAMKPFLDKNGKAYVLNFRGGDPKKPENYIQKEVPVTNAVLRYDEWRLLDDILVKIAEQRLMGVQDLRDAGLVRNIGDGMASTVYTWEQMSDGLEAAVSIDPVTRSKGDTVVHSTQHTPLPVIHSDYQISDRLLRESRNRGTGIDTQNAERATRKVVEKLEDMLFGATATLTYGGGTIHSYISHPDVNDVTLATAWDASSKTPAQIKDDVIAMKQASITAGYYGPWMLYVPTAYETVLDDDYDVSGASLKTIRQRVEDISGITGVKVIDRLPANNVLLVCMQSDCVDLLDGMPIQNVQWQSEGQFVHNYKVMTIQVPRVKSDYDGNSGITLLKA